MRIHIVAVSGTGMGSLAGLLRELGHEVSGSDTAFDPPMGPALREWGVRCLPGFDARNLEPRPDLVVIGNVCRPGNVEAEAARQAGIECTHIAGALSRFVLDKTSPLVVAGTHGKTTTTALAAFLLDRAGFAPGFLIGGLPADFPRSFRAPGPRRLGSGPGSGRRTPWVIEGDEYDTAYFEKTAKFLHYRPEVAVLTSIEHDHVDIYPTLESYLEAFRRFVALLPADGLLVANAADPTVRDLAGESRAEVAFYALEGEDTGSVAAHWLAAPAEVGERAQSFDLYAGGVACGRLGLSIPGRHNLKNALGALAAAVQGYGARLADVGAPLGRFQGVRRRQEVLGRPGGILLYDDFAHHPTAVREVLRALSQRHAGARLIAAFEPRSATACRRLHQDEYAAAFDLADAIFLAPLGRSNVPAEQALDLGALVETLAHRGKVAERCADVEQIVDRVAGLAKPGDVVVLMSNGPFGGLGERLLSHLEASHPAR